MEGCYLCGSLFTEDNNSIEHILLNAIGGKLKSKNLLCKNCNSNFGSDSDKILANELAFLSSFLEVKRNKGKNQDIKHGKTISGLSYNLLDGHKPQISKPIITEPTRENPFINIQARDESEAIQILEGLKRKYPDLDITNAKDKLVVEEYYLQEPLNFNFGVGSDGTFKSLTKSAVNYYIFTQKDTKPVKHLFEYLKGNEKIKVAKHFLSIDIRENDSSEVFHLIHLESNQNFLYCYIELFSAYSFIVLLSSKYSDRPINSTYCYDLINNIKVEKHMCLNLSKDHFDFNSILTTTDVEILQKRLNRIMQIGERIKTEREILNIINDGFELIMRKHEQPHLFSQEMHQELSSYIANRFAQFTNRNNQIDSI